MKKTIWLALTWFAIAACKDKNKPPECGCEGPTIQVVSDLPASYVGDGHFVLHNTNETGGIYFTSNIACVIPDTLAQSLDSRHADFLISGEIKQTCAPDNLLSSYASPDHIRITKIRKVL
jgi:hypothetical protein